MLMTCQEDVICCGHGALKKEEDYRRIMNLITSLTRWSNQYYFTIFK